MLGALRVGAIPVVDATYATDGGESAKGCDDPARFWRDGEKAPAVFHERGVNYLHVKVRAAGRNRTEREPRLSSSCRLPECAINRVRNEISPSPA